jgi:aspartokinase
VENTDMDIMILSLREYLENLEENWGDKTTQVNCASISEIYIGGENIDSPGLMMEISTILAEHSINIATNMQPMNPRVVIIGVSREHEQEAVKVLHEKLIKSSES